MKFIPRAQLKNAIVMREAYQKNPVAWIRDVLGRKLWSKQSAIVEALLSHRTVAVASCHAIGKSYTSANIALWFLCNHENSIVITTAPTMRQVKKILWKEISVAFKGARFPLAPPDALKTTELQLSEEWFAIGFTTRDSDATRFQGYHAPYVLVIGDEAAGLTPEVYEGIDAVLSGGVTKQLLVGNPTDPLSHFAKFFTMEGVAKFYVSAFDTPNFTEFGITIEDIRAKTWRAKITGPLPYPSLITPEWVAEKHAQWCGGTKEGETNPLWCARVMGQFPATSRDQLIPLQWLVAAQERETPPEVLADIDPDDVTVSADLARMGGDEIALGLKRGSWFRIKEAFAFALLTETAGRMQNIARDASTLNIRGDAIGVGAGALDICRDQGFEVTDINVSVRPSDPERYGTFRDEMYWQLRERLNPELNSTIDLDPNDDVLIGQASAIKYKVQGNGRIKVESKDEMKARGLPSPDRLECLAIAFCTPPNADDVFLFAGQKR